MAVAAMPKRNNRPLDTGGAPSAQRIIDALACGQRCHCQATVRKGRGGVHCPAHDDPTPSLSVEEKDGKVLVHCHAGCEQAPVIEALRERGLWPSAPRAPRNGAGREVHHELRDGNGAPVAVHVRRVGRDGKKIAGPWWEGGLAGRRVETLPLYGVEHLRDLPDGAQIVATEGEPACDALRALGVASVATVCGAAVTPDADALRPLARLAPILWSDNDDAGRAHMMRIAGRLHALGARPRVLRRHDAPPKADAADLIGQGGTVEDVRELLDAAEPWTPPLAEDGAAILDDVVALVHRYVAIRSEQAVALALFVAHTHAFDAADATPYISITSAEKRSGKTLLLEVLEPLVARPWLTGRVTAAVLVRKVDAETPTLLLDESDAAFKGDQDYAETLRGVLNTGYRRGGSYSACVGQGANIAYKDFQTFGAKAIAGIGRLPDTVADRSIKIELKRKAPDEWVERYRRRKVVPLATRLRERLESWAAAHVGALRDAEPTLPDALDDRACDVWEPLLAIADLAGGDWPERARSAALALSAGVEREDDSLGVRLLADVRCVFEERGTERLSSAELVAALVAVEEAPWGDLNGKPLDERKLARLLKPYGIRPHTVRIEDKTPKGYQRAAFEDDWSRYLPHIPAGTATSATTATASAPESNPKEGGVAGVAVVAANAGSESICPHRPPGETDKLWAFAETKGWLASYCKCCDAAVRDDLYDSEDGRCSTCRADLAAPERGGHLVRFALDLGAERLEADGAW